MRGYFPKLYGGEKLDYIREGILCRLFREYDVGHEGD
jgi:hypothetical protein